MLQEATLNDESVLDVEILVKRGVMLEFVGVSFASGFDAVHHSNDCGAWALLVKLVGL